MEDSFHVRDPNGMHVTGPTVKVATGIFEPSRVRTVEFMVLLLSWQLGASPPFGMCKVGPVEIFSIS